MQRKQIKMKSGRLRHIPVISEAEFRHLTFNENPGFCLDCGIDVEGVEPDARRYRCEACDSPNGVYGLEELLLMNLIEMTPDAVEVR